MFKAIVNGKSRGFGGGKIKGNVASWSEFYMGAEDFETAAVFTRLSYLPADHFWAILRRSFFPHSGQLPEVVGALQSITFWPRYDDPGDSGAWVEPDVLLRFDKLDLIVEVKRGDSGNLQTGWQLQREWTAVHASGENFDPQKTWLFALGGLSNGYAGSLFAEVCKTIPRFATCSWREFARSIRLYNIPQDPTAKRILDDLVEILSFHGYKEYLWGRELADMACLGQLHISPGSFEAMNSIQRDVGK